MLLSALYPPPGIASTPPVAAYSFDAGEGEVAEDLAGEHDGELNTVDWVKGKYGSAIYLDGNDDYVEIPGTSDLALTEEFSLSAWVRPDEDATWESVIWKETENFYSYSLMAGGEEAGVPEGALADKASSWVDVEGKEDLTDNAWSHLALTYDGANLRLYVNGELIDTEAAPPNNENSEGSLFFGTSDDEDFFNGRIDEVRLYDRALDAGEIAADRVTPIQTPSRGPVAAYSFDAGEGEVAEDLAGEHDGELNTVDWVKGKYGSAIYLDGNDDYVEIPGTSDLALTEEFSLSAWVRPDGTEKEAVVISKETGNFYSYQLYAGSREAAGVPEGFLAYEPFAWEDVEDETPLQAKTWSHLALTYDGAHLRLYVNGELIDTESSPPGQNNVGPLILGGNDDEEFFKGRIDEVRIYERALSESEAADVTRPTFNNAFFVDSATAEGQTTVWFNEAADAESPNGKAPFFTFRYAIDSGPFTAWKTQSHNYFEVATPGGEEVIALEVYASDAAGNRSFTESGSVSTLGGEPYVPGEEELKDAEKEAEAAAEPPVTVQVEEEGSGEEALRITKPSPSQCKVVASYPHISEHARREKSIRINAIGFSWCGFPGITGTVRVRLMRVVPKGSIEVSDSGRNAISSISYKKTFAIIEPFECEPGQYYTATTAHYIPPPKVVMSRRYLVAHSKVRYISVCR